MSTRNRVTEEQISRRDYRAGIHQAQSQSGVADRQRPNRTMEGARGGSTMADRTKGQSTVAFGARAAVLAGVLATGCAAAVPVAVNAVVAQPAHAMTAIALGATSGGVATPDGTTCCG
jgi:hypothetical protein